MESVFPVANERSRRATAGACVPIRGDLRLGKADTLPGFKQGIEQITFFAFNAFNFRLHAGTAQQLFDQLIMCLHV